MENEKFEQKETNVFEELDRYDSSAINSSPSNEPKWMATLALVLSIFGIVPGLVFAIIGLNKLSDTGSKVKCIIAIVLNVAWFILGFVIGIVFAEELAGLYY